MTASFSSLSVDRKKVLAVLAVGTFSSRIKAGRRPTVSSRGASGSPNKMARIADVSIWREPTADYALLSNIDPSSAILKILLQTTVASQLTVPLQSALSPTAKRIRRPDINRMPAIPKIPQNPANPASDNRHTKIWEAPLFKFPSFPKFIPYSKLSAAKAPYNPATSASPASSSCTTKRTAKSRTSPASTHIPCSPAD